MCWCTPSIRTPFCGKPECHPPGSIPAEKPKGAYTSECARTACDHRPALYWNPHTGRYYCLQCARKLNEVFRADGLRLIEGLPSQTEARR